MTLTTTIQLRRDLAADWASTNPVLHQGEIGIETDTDKAKLGDGSTAWASLAYWDPAGGSGPLPPAQGGTGQATQQAAMDALAGAVTSGDYLRGNGSHVAMSAIQAADLPASVTLLSSPNVFTASPQSVGTAFSSGQTLVYSGALTLANNGAAPPTNAPPAVKLYSYCGGASGNNGWDIGVDTHNHGGGQDFYIGKVVNGATTDLFYMNYASGALGLGAATPPDDNYLLEILTPGSSTTTCLGLGLGSGATGDVLDIFNSSGVNQIWIDDTFAINSVAGGTGVFFTGEATNNTVMTLANNAKTLQYTFAVKPGSNIFEFKYATGGQVIWWGGTDGSFRTFHNLGFYGVSAVAQPNTAGTTTGFTAVNTATVVAAASTFTGNTGSTAYTIGDIVNALKKLGLMAA